jgi:uncharacterized protein with GYD domain
LQLNNGLAGGQEGKGGSAVDIFIMTGKYSVDAVKKMSGERTVKANQIVQQCGGAIVGAYATLGEADMVLIVKFPGVAEAMKASVGLNKALGISFATRPALRIEDFDKFVIGKL